MSYNILYGAGVDRLWDTALPPNLAGQSRLSVLLSVIQQVGEELSMNYYLAWTASRFHLGLLTKFPILEAENLSAEVRRQGAL